MNRRTMLFGTMSSIILGIVGRTSFGDEESGYDWFHREGREITEVEAHSIRPENSNEDQIQRDHHRENGRLFIRVHNLVTGQCIDYPIESPAT